MWTPNLPDIGEARLIAIRDILRGKISDLNTCLSRDSQTSILITGDYPALSTDCVDIGDTAAEWSSTEEGAIKIAVCAGGMREGLDYEVEQEFIDETTTWGLRQVLHTSIFLYLGDVMQITDPRLQARYREILQCRLGGWCRGVLNLPENREIVLASQEFVPVGGSEFDVLTRCRARTGMKNYIPRSAGNTTTYGVHIDHQGIIA